jgi:hypothetical protein
LSTSSRWTTTVFFDDILLALGKIRRAGSSIRNQPIAILSRG